MSQNSRRSSVDAFSSGMSSVVVHGSDDDKSESAIAIKIRGSDELIGMEEKTPRGREPKRRKASEASSRGPSPPSQRKGSVSVELSEDKNDFSRRRPSKFSPSEGRVNEDDIKQVGNYELNYESAPNDQAAFSKYRISMYWAAATWNSLTCCFCWFWEGLASAICTLGIVVRSCFCLYPKPSHVSDQEVIDIFTDVYPFNTLRKFNENGKDFLVDTSGIERVRNAYGEHLVGAKCFVVDGKLQKIRAAHRDYYPGDYLWEAAKSHLLQGALYTLLLIVHPRLHFPNSQVYHHIRTFFTNKRAATFKLLQVHSKFAETLDKGVLFSKESVLEGSDSKTCCCWAAQPFGKKEAEQNLLALGWNNDYAMGMDKELADLGFVRTYEVIQDFVAEVFEYDCRCYPSMREESVHLMKSLQTYLGDAIGEDFAFFFADFIFKVTVDHSLSHHYFDEVTDHRFAMDIRFSPFYRISYAPSVRVRPCSFIRQSYYKAMFFSWWNNRLFQDNRFVIADYKFRADELVEAQNKFIREIRDSIPRQLHDVISASIEF